MTGLLAHLCAKRVRNLEDELDRERTAHDYTIEQAADYRRIIETAAARRELRLRLGWALAWRAAHQRAERYRADAAVQRRVAADATEQYEDALRAYGDPTGRWHILAGPNLPETVVLRRDLDLARQACTRMAAELAELRAVEHPRIPADHPERFRTTGPVAALTPGGVW